ncbi:MAG: Crp/Fnr family transcriptional regulator [Gemmatimonadaceae bacterium]|nr:Crp/Fnr family transcriptional regulator [Chitinophagaceae bacterium]
MKLIKGECDTSRTFIYQHCLREWWPAIDSNRKIYQFKKGEKIFAEGDNVEGVFFMVKGVSKVHKYWKDDKELIIRFARENDIIGHRGLSTRSTVYPVTATALTDGIVCFISLDFFKMSLRVNTDFSYSFLMFFADELHLSEQRMRDLAHMPVKGRVAQALINLEKKFSTDADGFISYAVSRQDIAAYTGAAYETVYKILTEWTETGIIKTDSKKIAVINPSALSEMISA